MRKILLITMLMLFGVSVMSQTQTMSDGVGYNNKALNTVNQNVTIPKSMLSQEQLAQLEMEDRLRKMESYGKWVGVGSELGIAVRESLLAVVDVADKFGGTDIGKFTLVMVAWKIIGKDLVRIVLGILFIILFTIFWWINYKTTFIIKKIRLTGSGFKFWEKHEYTLIQPERYDGIEFVRYLYIATYVASFGITYAIMFG